MITRNKGLISERYTDIDQSVKNAVEMNNSLLNSYFNNIKLLSELLPQPLNQLTVLADQVTDALVITGKTRLSSWASSLKVVKQKGIQFNTELNTISLAKVEEYNYQINSKQSSIISQSNNYSLYNDATQSITSFSRFLDRKESIDIISNDRSYKYTFSLGFSSKVLINSLVLQLGLDTESYPLISEIYYIDDNNKKRNCFIHNSSSNTFNTDLTRVKDNKYELSLEPFQANRVYISFEDSDKALLSITSLEIKKAKYVSEGEITLGPITSSLPILKSSLEASTSQNTRFLISHNGEDYVELLKVEDIDMSDTASKIVRYNTVNSNSIATVEDVKTLYLKVALTAITPDSVDSIFYKIGRDSFTSYTKVINPAFEVRNSTLYKDSEFLSYGIEKKYMSYESYRGMEPQVIKVVHNNRVKVKGFVSTPISYTSEESEDMFNCTVTTLPIQKGDTEIDCSLLEPVSSTLFGYVINKKETQDFNTSSSNIVIPLKEEYENGIYRIRQDNLEILIDLSNGFITGCSDVVFVVAPEKEVKLLNELGKVIKVLTPITLRGEISVVSLVEEGMFEVPSSESLIFNTLYPFILNTEDMFSLSDYHVVTTQSLVELTNVYEIEEEEIETTIHLSRENSNTLQVSNTSFLDKYTKTYKTVIPAFTVEKAIKLKDKNLKRGSFSLEKDTDPYLTEVTYQNGIEEFKILSYSTEESIVSTQGSEFVKEWEIELSYPVADVESITASIRDRYEINLQIKKVSGTYSNVITVYTEDYLFSDETIEITYLHLNQNTSNYYSVDYTNGILYLSSPTNIDLELTYQHYITYIKGTKAIQMAASEYTSEGNTIEIKEKTDTVTYTALYDYKALRDIPTTSPIVRDIKINYVNTRDEESLL